MKSIFHIKAFKVFLKPIWSTVMVLSFSPSLLNIHCRRLPPVLFKIYQLFSFLSLQITFLLQCHRDAPISNLGCLFPFSVWSFCHFLVSASRAILGRKTSYLQAYFVLQDAEKPGMYCQSLRNIVWVNWIFFTKCDTYQEDFE